MLHIVQVVFAGMAETPQVFPDQAGAESAFVDHVKNFWKQSYSEYCDRNGVGMECFASAKAFLETLDRSEKSQLNYWVVNQEDAGLGRTKHLEWMRQQQENVAPMVKQVEQRSAVVRKELAGMLDDLAHLTGYFADKDSPPAGIQAVRPESATAPSPPQAEPEEPEEAAEEESAEKYTTKEWKAFVGSVMNVCGGGRSESALFTRHDWRQDVYSNLTSLEYWDWVAAKINKYKGKAEKAGYAVIKDPDSPGDYQIKTPEGTVDKTSFFSEWDAWCHAAVNLPEEAAARAKAGKTFPQDKN